ncbi:MAG: flagellar M-ring protein FliF [Firmicutes bacterium]|nr:flagellar M-ring protein FliF [Alicyclobacillaceae bacterium]MCL6497287.1 flagellar M-ring protein FliF [Bacillota bacterium]
MNERIQQLGRQVVERIRAMDNTQRLRLGALLALGVLPVALAIGFVTRTNWQPLYTNLSPQAAGQITAVLTQQKIPYQLADQGRTVLVPQQDVDQVRVELADRNIPSSSAGTVGMPTPLTFSLGESNQELQMQALLNLEAGLQQTIDTINGVDTSRVLINEPPPALFGEGTNPATASVFVQLKPGASLSPAAVRGIMNLVAHAVNGLQPKDVSVVDQNGTLLSAQALQPTAASNLAGVASSELQAEEAVDQAIENNVASMLNQVLGPGQAVVRVNAALNFNSGTQTQVTYGKGVISSQQVETSTSQNAPAPVTQAGAGGNVPGYPTVNLGTGNSQSNQNTTITRYLVPKTETQTTLPAGSISRLTVAVAVDQRLTPAEQANLQNLVAQAAGIQPGRGDRVTVVGQPFNRQQVNQVLAQMAAAQRAQRLRQEIAAAVAALAGLGLILLVRRQLRRAQKARESVPAALPAPETPAVVIERSELGAGPEAEYALDQERRYLGEMLKRDPQNVARLVRTWLEQEG